MPRGKAIVPLDGCALTDAAWEVLVNERKSLGDGRPVLRLDQFLALIESDLRTSREQREIIVRQARVLLGQLYPHLPFKIERHGIEHPDKLLDIVQEKLDEIRENQFQDAMIQIFSSMRDAHTVYGAPPPLRGAVAFLPFQMRYWQDGKDPRFLVTRVMFSPVDGGFEEALFGPGAEILHWGNAHKMLPIEHHVAQVGGRAAGANCEAVYTRGAMNCTLRPLTYCKFPFVFELPDVVVIYLPAGADRDDQDAIRAIKLPWGFLQGFDSRLGFPNSVFSVSPLNSQLSSCNQYIHYVNDQRKEQDLRATNDLTQVSLLPNTFEFQFSAAQRRYPLIDFRSICQTLPGRKYGYLRIKQFGDGSDDREATARLLTEFRRILKMMDVHAPDGLVLDVRGNPGGDVIAAERMLQMLTAERITPEPFHLANTSAVMGTLRNVRGAGRQSLTREENLSLTKARQTLQLWLDLVDGTTAESKERVTAGRRLTEQSDANSVGQVYCGPVVLLTDALTFSAADIFSAGFQDHGIGPVVGVHGRTGGGGGTYWTLDGLREVLGPRPAAELAPLPKGVTMSVAFHRCSRVGLNVKKWLEDDGVKPDKVHSATAQDVIDNYPGAVALAFAEVAKIQPRRVDVTRLARAAEGGVEVELRAEGIDFVRFFFDGRFALETDVRGFAGGTITVPAAAGAPRPQSIAVAGYTLGKGAGDPKVRCIRRFALEQPQPARASAAVASVTRSVVQFNPVTGRRR